MAENGDRVHFVTLYTRVLLQLAAFPRISQETLARKLDVTMRTAQRHLTELEEEGYVHVDRSTKPFQYEIDWTRSLPYVPWMRLILLHPEMKVAVEGLSEVAAQAYTKASGEKLDPAEALHGMFATGLQGAIAH